MKRILLFRNAEFNAPSSYTSLSANLLLTTPVCTGIKPVIMKRFLVFSIGVSSVMLSSAQMRVTPSGQVRVGYNVDLVQDDIEPIAPDYYDHNAGLIVVGREGATTNSGYMAFGPGSDVLVGESPLYPNILMMDITSGILFRKGRRTVFKYGQFGNTESATPEKFSFSCDVVSTAFHVASDMRLKKNISTLSGEDASLLDITPVRYNLDNSRIFAARSAEPLDSFDVRLTMPYDTHDRYGFIAQEVREIYPELVSEDSEGMLAIDYIGFIPLLVDEIKNLTARFEMQGDAINSLSTVTRNRPGQTAFMEGLPESGESIVLYQKRRDYLISGV